MRVLAYPRIEPENPYVERLYRELARHGMDVERFGYRRALAGRWHLWHLHWPERPLWDSRPWRAYAKWLVFWLLLKLARLKGTRVVWTVHNLDCHEDRHPALERLLWKGVLANLDAVICLSVTGRRLLRERHPAAARLPAYVIPHGHYRGSYPDTTTRAAARAALGLDGNGPVVLFIGQVRRYKRVPRLITCFRAAAPKDWRLVVAGACLDEALGAEARAAAAGDERIVLSLGYVEDADMQRYLRAADLVVLPYADILNSGSAILALSFDRPVLVPDRGAMGELRELAGAGWVRLYSGALTPAILAEAVRWARRPRRAARPDLAALEWEGIGRRTAEALEEIAGAG